MVGYAIGLFQSGHDFFAIVLIILAPIVALFAWGLGSGEIGQEIKGEIGGRFKGRFFGD